ncbi:MAG: hypothetical protein F6J97_20420, partial [Leptolyngbya sp. SIO4C1]|nr:hypothetical protein [Leptolyngbya sp. SIO4C1]
TGYRYEAIGENIAAGYSTPRAVFDGWMASSGHRANILSDRFSEIGFGSYRSPNSTYGTYWVQHFGRPVDADQSSQAAFIPENCGVIAQASADKVAVRGVSHDLSDAVGDAVSGTAPLSTAIYATASAAPTQESVPESGIAAGLGLMAIVGLSQRSRR